MAKTTTTAKSTTESSTTAIATPKNILQKKHVNAKFRGFSNKALKDGKKKFILRFSIPDQEQMLFVDKFYASEQDRNSVAGLIQGKEYNVTYTEKPAMINGTQMVTKDGEPIMNRNLWSTELSYKQKIADLDNF